MTIQVDFQETGDKQTNKQKDKSNPKKREQAYLRLKNTIFFWISLYGRSCNINIGQRHYNMCAAL